VKTWTDRNGRTWRSDRARPFVAVVGERRHDRHYGSLKAAAAQAPAGARLFFEYAPGTGKFIGYASDVAA
jgi:hypothetical protein